MKPTEHDDESIPGIKEGLDQLDELFPPVLPELSWFERQVEEASRRRRSRLVRELLLFWLSALLLLLLLYMTAMQKPAVFIAIQAAAVCAPALWALRERRVTRHEGRL